ncbi:ZPR1 zinc-finger domain protein [compost metagenome]
MILSSGTCRSCGFKYRDVRVAEATKPKQIIVRVLGEEQLRYLLVKSALTGVLIPEQGYEIVPGPASTGFISTVEGILHRIMDALEVACRDAPEKKEECEKHRRWLQEAIDGKRRFTLILCDFEGASKVIGKLVEERELGKECERFREYVKDRLPPT